MVSLALSLCAAYLFVDAKPALAFNQKVSSVRQLLADERPEAAAQSLTRLAASERLPREHEAQVHLLLAESIDAAGSSDVVEVINGDTDLGTPDG